MSRNDRGSGSILGIAVVGSVIALVSLALPLYIGLSVRASVEGAADAAVLAAADVASGIAPGTPCAKAAQIAAANSARISTCTTDGLVVIVVAERPFLGLQLTAGAKAGPPDAGTN